MIPLIIGPGTASAVAERTDLVFTVLACVSAAIVLLVAGLVFTFAIRFRKGSAAPRHKVAPLVSRQIELGWTAGTLFLGLFLFWYAAQAAFLHYALPPDALEIHVEAKQWMWKLQHPNGAGEIDALHVPVGRAVHLFMTSDDVIHSFYVPALRLKQDVVPGRLNEMWFTADREGTYPLRCAEYCGTDHSRMVGEVVAIKPEDYGRWLAAQPQGPDLAHEGEALFTSLGCAGCHGPSSSVHAPKLDGLYGRPVPLADGRSINADEAYIRDSILMPRRDVVAGFEPIMPSFAGRVGEPELAKLVAYIRSLAAPKESHP